MPAGQLLPVPEGIGLDKAAALPEVTCTVWSNVFMIAHLRPGETLLVHGGASGIGTMAIQLAKAVGAKVAVTAGSKEKLDFCADLGADVLINYREQDFVEEIKAATDGAGADVILDNMGAKYLDRNVQALAVNGRLAIIGMQGGIKGELNIAMLLGKRGAVTATSLRARPAGEKASIVAAVREHVWPLISAGHVRPVVDRELPMSDAPRRTGSWRRAGTSARCCSRSRRTRRPGRGCGGAGPWPRPASGPPYAQCDEREAEAQADEDQSAAEGQDPQDGFRGAYVAAGGLLGVERRVGPGRGVPGRLRGDSALRLLAVRWPVRVTDPGVLVLGFFLRLVRRRLFVLLFLLLFLCLLRLLRRRGCPARPLAALPGPAAGP